MFYEDLSEYDYSAEDSFEDRDSGFYALWYRPAYARLNVGWLEAGRPYPTSPVPEGIVEKLEAKNAAAKRRTHSAWSSVSTAAR